MTLNLAISPCPNDTFIFDGIHSGAIKEAGIDFQIHLADISTLNDWAIQGTYDLIKLSYAHYFHVMSDYAMLSAGGAMGVGVGPLLIELHPSDWQFPEKLRIALPGKDTTANFLFSLAYPTCTHKIFMPFHQIEEAVLSGEADAGVIIHENRFTYASKGLQLITDLGEFWSETYQLPIPLGGIAIKRTLGLPMAEKLNHLIRKSIQYSWQRYPLLSPWIQQCAREMSEDVMRSHIQLYVNPMSEDPGISGREAVEKMASLSGFVHHPPIFAPFYGSPV